jgi:prepilin-type N-terminal cleavage/methylation domain-containing protein
MRMNTGKRQAFTLVEMMIVVAIVGILSVIAAANFQSMVFRSKRGELASNVEGIKSAELAYKAAFNAYLTVPQHPLNPGKGTQEWERPSAWEVLGWMPDGAVRGSYLATSNNSEEFDVDGYSDVDADDEYAHYRATQATSARMISDGDIY